MLLALRRVVVEIQVCSEVDCKACRFVNMWNEIFSNFLLHRFQFPKTYNNDFCCVALPLSVFHLHVWGSHHRSISLLGVSLLGFVLWRHNKRHEFQSRPPPLWCMRSSWNLDGSLNWVRWQFLRNIKMVFGDKGLFALSLIKHSCSSFKWYLKCR